MNIGADGRAGWQRDPRTASRSHAERNYEKTAEMEEDRMKIALPIAEGVLCMHFGHCEKFALVDIDAGGKKIVSRSDVDAPPHQPGLLPGWLAERGVGLVIAGGMGSRALGFFKQYNIQVITGAPAEAPEKVVADFLDNRLKTGSNVCDH